MALKWQWSQFNELTLFELYEILKLRQRVFIVEQNCPYLDADGLDLKGVHLLGWDLIEKRDCLVACVRILPAGTRFEEISIGRVVTAPEVRRTGVGKKMMKEAIIRTRNHYGHLPIRISAQMYLEKFYNEVGFKKVSDPYLEDGIPHIEMLNSAI